MKSRIRSNSVSLGIICILLLTLSGCVARLPERPDLASDVIPELATGNARVFVYMGTLYTPSGFGGFYEHDLNEGIDANVFIDNKYVSYVNEDAIVIDLIPGTYDFNYQPVLASESDRDKRKSVPYELTLRANDVVYLEANIKNMASQESQLLGLGGAIGGAIYGANLKFADYFEEEPIKGIEMIGEMRIVEYHNLSKTTLEDLRAASIRQE